MIHGELEHGTELTYSEQIDMDEAAFQQYISPKDELGVFAPVKVSRGPCYISKDVVDELREKTFRPGSDEGTDTPNSIAVSSYAVSPIEGKRKTMLEECAIVIDPDVMNGMPCFRGTRVPFKNLIDYLEGGHSPWRVSASVSHRHA